MKERGFSNCDFEVLLSHVVDTYGSRTSILASSTAVVMSRCRNHNVIEVKILQAISHSRVVSFKRKYVQVNIEHVQKKKKLRWIWLDTRLGTFGRDVRIVRRVS